MARSVCGDDGWVLCNICGDHGCSVVFVEMLGVVCSF